MSESSTLGELAKKLQESKSRELKELEQIENEKLKEFSRSLRESLARELDSIKSDISSQKESIKESMNEISIAQEKLQEKINQTSKVSIKTWLVPTLVGVSIMIGLVASNYALGTWMKQQQEELSKTREETEIAQKNYKKLEGHSLVKKIYDDGIVIQKKPEVWQRKDGTWVVRFKVEEK